MSSNISPRYVAIAASSGLFTGMLAGLVGLGGAEERVPFILYGLKIPVYDMVVSNLIMSFGTSGLNFALRAQAGLLPTGSIPISLAMIAGSLFGAYLGATIAHRISEKKLKAFLAFVLSIVVVRLVIDVLGGLPAPSSSLPTNIGLTLAVAFGFLIGVISGAIGSAGGEYRIPVLIYTFGLPIKFAGTASQFVALPTILVALYRHRNLGFLSRRSLVLAAFMGIPSLVGVGLSQLILLASSDQFIRLVFLVILLYTVARLVLELRRPSVSSTEFRQIS